MTDKAPGAAQMQVPLFDPGESRLLPGLRYERLFLTAAEELGLIGLIRSLPLQAAKYKSHTARRRIFSYGSSFDFSTNRLMPGRELDHRLGAIRERVAAWMGVQPAALSDVLVSEYAEGTPLGWHRDVPGFEEIAGVSLGGNATLRFRPYRPDSSVPGTALQLDVEPRSIYGISGTARWEWQHAVAPARELRWSLTFRTRSRAFRVN